ELARALLFGLEQPHVLDRDHRLVGEGREQLYLLVGEGAHNRPGQRQRADRCAFDSTSVSRTACRSNVERLITLSTSAVAVCCCSDSRSSLSNRAFSIAMTACAAKFVSRSICLSVSTS